MCWLTLAAALLAPAGRTSIVTVALPGVQPRTTNLRL